MSGYALADTTNIATDGGTGQTTVNYTVNEPEPVTEFVVIIPASVTVPEEG